MLELQRSALRRKLQIIVASHSPVVLNSVPPEGRIFLDRDERTGKIRREPLYRDIFQKALYGQSQDRLSILCEDEVAEGVIRGVLDELNVELGLRHEDVVVGRNTGRGEFRSHVRTLGKFGKLSDFVLVLDGDSRAEENRLKTVAEEFGHHLQPLFLPGDASPEQWLWEVLRARTDEFAATFGHAAADMRKMMDRAGALGEGAVQQHDTAKGRLGDLRRGHPANGPGNRPERRQKRGEEQIDPRIAARLEGADRPLAKFLTQTHRPSAGRHPALAFSRMDRWAGALQVHDEPLPGRSSVRACNTIPASETGIRTGAASRHRSLPSSTYHLPGGSVGRTPRQVPPTSRVMATAIFDMWTPVQCSGVHQSGATSLRTCADLVDLHAVRTRTMPPGNPTGMTDAERARLGAWLAVQRE